MSLLRSLVLGFLFFFYYDTAPTELIAWLFVPIYFNVAPTELVCFSFELVVIL